MNTASELNVAQQIERLATLMQAQTQRDNAGQCFIGGDKGCIRAHPKFQGFAILLRGASPAAMRNDVLTLTRFAKLTGLAERVAWLHLPVMPTPEQAEVLRTALQVRAKRHYSPRQLEWRAQRKALRQARCGD
jgi:hypothetical protein